MDVRCEKCQTEYELDEARLKPGGVTVKCTNCGHMFKIRKRSNTNVGAPAIQAEPSKPQQQTMQGSGFARADSMLDEAPTRPGEEAPTTAAERQWLIRLENGEQKSCKELATLQQWIVSNIVGRESLISRTGKTWKRLGDIAELAQYFDIADEARTTADNRKPASASKPPVPSTMLGIGAAPPAPTPPAKATATAAGGTILPDDDDEKRTTPARRPTTTPPPPPVAKRRPTTQPPPPPKKSQSQSGPLPEPPAKGPSIPPPPGGRATAMWASDSIKEIKSPQTGNRESAPFVGKIGAIPDEPAFAAKAGRIRTGPSEASFDTDRVRIADEDDDAVMPRRKGSSAAVWILLAVLILGAGATALVYVFVFRKEEPVVQKQVDAAVVASVDAPPVVTPIDAAAPPPANPLDAARAELAHDNEARLQSAYDGLAGKTEPDELALRAQLGAALAQALLDRAGLVDKAEADKLRKQAKTLATDNVTAAQKAHKAAPTEPGPNLALAHVLRLQGKPAREIKRYLDAAKAKAGDWARDIAYADALLLARDGKLDDAKAAFAAIDSGEGKLETSNDVRARFHLALVAHAQNRPGDAKPLVDQVLAAQPEHAGARALAAKLETLVAKTDPLPPEDPKPGPGSGAVGPGSGKVEPPPVGGNDYDGLVARANKTAETNCVKAMELYGKALEIKPNGVEALTGQGYCALDAKNFATAHRKFSTALATSGRYEPALAGVAETYQRQGRKEDAIAAWRRYLDVFPGAKRALRALEVLGAGASEPPKDPPPNQGSGTGGGSGDGATQPPPPPPPQPTPPPAGTGSGSG